MIAIYNTGRVEFLLTGEKPTTKTEYIWLLIQHAKDIEVFGASNWEAYIQNDLLPWRTANTMVVEALKVLTWLDDDLVRMNAEADNPFEILDMEDSK